MMLSFSHYYNHTTLVTPSHVHTFLTYKAKSSQYKYVHRVLHKFHESLIIRCKYFNINVRLILNYIPFAILSLGLLILNNHVDSDQFHLVCVQRA